MDSADGVCLSAPEYLRHRLTPAEAAHFATQGFLLIEDALAADQHWLLEELVHAMHETKLSQGRAPHETIVQAAFSPANNLQDNEQTMHLLKNERVFPKVVDILGANIKVYHSHWNYTPGADSPGEPDYASTFGYHQDSHRVNIEMGHEQADGPRPRLSVKCAYYLTDCSSSGSGNTWVVPGSHLLDTLPSVAGGVGQPEGAVPVLAPANSCLIFDRRLWHAVSPNYSADPRLVCFVGYAPRWMKPRDAMWTEPSITRTDCPIVRQLLGDATSMAGTYGGNRHDIPLRYWLHNIGGDKGLGMNLKISGDWGSRGLGDSLSGGLDGDRGHATHPRNPERIHLPIGPEVGTYSFPGLAGQEQEQEQVETDPAEVAAAAQAAAEAELGGLRLGALTRLARSDEVGLTEAVEEALDTQGDPKAELTAAILASERYRPERHAGGRGLDQPQQPQLQLQLQPAPGIDLDPDIYLAHRLSPAEREQFETEGYLLIENALPEAHHTALLAAVDEARHHSVVSGQNTDTEMTHAAAFAPPEVNILQSHAAVTRLLTNEKVLPKVVDLLGINISCYHFHVNITPPAPGEPSASGEGLVPDADDISANVQTFRFHQDSGQPTDMEQEDFDGDREPPQFSLKCGYFLTDASQPGMANTWIIPRRQKYDTFDAPSDGIGQPVGAIPVCAPANSCLMFDRRLFHTPTPNWSSTTRKVCFVGYGFRWLQPKDGMYVEPAMAAATCPVLKQMMGYTNSNAGLYQPNSADTPIRPWLHSIGVDEPLGPAAKRPEFGQLDGLLPRPTTVRELEAQGLFEGDVGHSTAPRDDAFMYLRRDAGGEDGQSMKESLDVVERRSRYENSQTQPAKM